MTLILEGLGAALSAVGSAAASVGTGVASAVGGALGTAGGGLSMSQILAGTATALSAVASIGASNAEADALRQQAADQDMQQSLETVQDIGRRTSIKREMLAALGQREAAYAASGVDLSFGTAAETRTEALRDADLALTTSAGTTLGRQSRQREAAIAYRRQASKTHGLGLLSAASGLAGGFAKIL